jgi:tryptophanyl-tRNA synthetase
MTFDVNKYSEELNKLGVRHEILVHPEMVEVVDVMGYLGLPVSEGFSTLIYIADGKYVAINRRDDTKLKLSKVREVLGVDELKMVPPEEFEKLTGLIRGAARPLAPVEITLFDEKMFEKEYLMGGSGSNSVTIKYLTEDLKKIPNSRVVDVANETMNAGEGRVLAGIRSSGQLHLGNYLGAVKGMIALQDDPRYATNYMVADLHAITTPYKVSSFQHDTRSVIIDYLSAGLDPEKSVLFVQSHVREHVELAYLLSTAITVARAQHLPTYKDKFNQQQGNVSMALFQYPVLMAADILLYKADLVPVGIDQEPHIEIAREIARKMNAQYGMDFSEPTRFATTGEYVPSLTGTGKMSKSIAGSYINLTDDLVTIKKRLAGAPTDSGKGNVVPTEGGVTNLLKLVELFEGVDRRKEYENQYVGDGVRYGDLKSELAEAIDKELAPIREKRKELEANISYVDKVIKEGAEKARAIASVTVSEVKQKMGLG